MNYHLSITKLRSDSSGGSFWEHSGVIPGSFRDHSGIIPGSFWDHSGVIPGSFRGHSGFILGSVWDHFGIIVVSFWDHVVIIVASFCDHFGITLESFRVTLASTWDHFCESKRVKAPENKVLRATNNDTMPNHLPTTHWEERRPTTCQNTLPLTLQYTPLIPRVPS